jgi:cytochrome bd-type quinol oxidase subunit 2
MFAGFPVWAALVWAIHWFAVWSHLSGLPARSSALRVRLRHHVQHMVNYGIKFLLLTGV